MLSGQQDELLQQMLSGQSDSQILGLFNGAAGARGNEPLATALLTGLGATLAPKTATDAFLTDRVPLLQAVKRPAFIAFFVFCFTRRWVGRWGLLQGAMAGSYLDLLAVPLRVQASSPFRGKSFAMAQFYVDGAVRLLGFIINLARGKSKLWGTPPLAGMVDSPSLSPSFGTPLEQPVTERPLRSTSPVIDTDAVFLD